MNQVAQCHTLVVTQWIVCDSEGHTSVNYPTAGITATVMTSIS